MRMRSAGVASSSRMSSAGQRDERVLQRAGAGAVFQRRGGALGDDAAVVDDGDVVGHPFGFLHRVRGEEYGDLVFARQATHEFPDMAACLWVQPERRLVEEQQARLVQEGARDFEPALCRRGCLT